MTQNLTKTTTYFPRLPLAARPRAGAAAAPAAK